MKLIKDFFSDIPKGSGQLAARAVEYLLVALLARAGLSQELAQECGEAISNIPF